MFYWKDQDVDGSKDLKKNPLPETSRALAPLLYTFTPLLNGSLLGLASGFCEWKQRRHSAPRTAPGFPDTSEQPSALLSHKWVNKWNADSRVGGQFVFCGSFFFFYFEWVNVTRLLGGCQTNPAGRTAERDKQRGSTKHNLERKQVTCYSGFWIPNNWAPS